MLDCIPLQLLSGYQLQYPEKRIKYHQFIDNYGQLDDKEYRRYLSEYLPKDTNKEDIMTFSDFCRNEGRKEGEKEGEKTILIRLLQQRFNSIPDWIQAKLEQADLSSLENWSMRILNAKTIEEVVQ